MALLASGCSSKSVTPTYFGKIMLGPNKGETQWVHFIVQGSAVYFDENTNGLADDSELLSNSILKQKSQIDSKTEYQISAEVGIDPKLVSDTLPQRLNVTVDIENESKFQMSGTMILTRIPEDSNWLHFGGPLKFFAMSNLSLRKASKVPEEIKLFFGTIADGADESSNAWKNRTTVVIPDENPPFPIAKIQFEGTEIDPIILPMDHFC